MKHIRRGRGQGKSRWVLMHSHQTGSTIICYSLAEAERLTIEAEHLGLSIPTPKTITQAAMLRPPQGTNYIIDELDMCLESLLSANINATTYTPREPDE